MLSIVLPADLCHGEATDLCPGARNVGLIVEEGPIGGLFVVICAAYR